MSAFDRHPLRASFEATAKEMLVWNEKRHPSPQNRRVRYAVELDLARARSLNTGRVTRQQRRLSQRRNWA